MPTTVHEKTLERANLTRHSMICAADLLSSNCEVPFRVSGHGETSKAP